MWNICWGLEVIFWSFCFEIELLILMVNVLIFVWWISDVVCFVLVGDMDCLFVIINKILVIGVLFLVDRVKLCWWVKVSVLEVWVELDM